MFGLAWRAWGLNNQHLIDTLKENEILMTPRIEHAFRSVDRAIFVPSSPEDLQSLANMSPAAGAAIREQAFVDGPVKVGPIHLSAPHMYALVLEKLQIESGMKFLNVGSGSGYLSSVVSCLVGPSGMCHGVERNPVVVAYAQKTTARWLKMLNRLRKERKRADKEKLNMETEELKQSDATSSSVPLQLAPTEPVAVDVSMHDVTSSSTSLPVSQIEDIDAEDAMRDDGEEDENVSVAEQQNPYENITIQESRRAANRDAMRLAAANTAATPSTAGDGSLSPVASAAPTATVPTHTPQPAPAIANPPTANNAGVGGPAAHAAMEFPNPLDPTGRPKRGIIGPQTDPPSINGGDSEAAEALIRSIQPLDQFFSSLLAPPLQNTPSPTPSNGSTDSLPQNSPSPPPAAATATAVPAPTAPITARPVSNVTPARGLEFPSDLPLPVPSNVIEFLAGDAFDLDARYCGLYDRIYVGAAVPEEHIPFFASLLHPAGKCVGPFGSAMRVISKTRSGEIVVEKVSDVAYAPMVLPTHSDNDSTKPFRSQALQFHSPIFDPPHGFARLPKPMRDSIDALLMLQRRDGRRSPLGKLPFSVLMHLMSFLDAQSYLDRAQGIVPWAPDVNMLLQQTLLRVQYVTMRLQHVIKPSSIKINADEEKEKKELETIQSRCEEGLLLEAKVRSWQEISWQGPAGDSFILNRPLKDLSSDDSAPSSSSSTLDTAAAAPNYFFSSSVGRLSSSELPVLNEIRGNPTNASTFPQHLPIDQQLIWLYWHLNRTLFDSLYHQRKYPSMLRYAKRLLTIHPAEMEVWRKLVEAFLAREDLEEAQAAAARAVRIAGERQLQLDESVLEDFHRLHREIETRLPSYQVRQRQLSTRLLGMMIQNMLAQAAEPGNEDMFDGQEIDARLEFQESDEDM